MSGRMHLDGPHRPLPPHTHLVLGFTGGRELRCANARRIASGVHLLTPARPEASGPLAALGPDALSITAEEFLRRLRGRTSPVKAALLNQSVLAGVGNIYSDEALFRAGIRPTRRVHRIGSQRLLRLHRALREVLNEAVAAGGSTLATSTPFAGVRGELGRFTLAHRVYGRFGRPCPRCRSRLRRTQVGGRTSTYCPRCQK